MKFKKLNPLGFAHHFLLAIVVVGVAAGGTFYLVASKADSCDVSSPTSGPTPASSYDCGPVSGVSDPSDLNTDLTCKINGLTPTPSYGTTFKPTVTITNHTGRTINAFSATSGFGVSNDSGEGSGAELPINIPVLAANASVLVNLPQDPYVVPYRTQTVTTGTYQVDNADRQQAPTFKCDFSFILPGKPTKLPLSCVINNVPTNPKYGQTISATYTITNPNNQDVTNIRVSRAFVVAGQDSQATNLTVASIAGKGSVTTSFSPYTVEYAADSSNKSGSYLVSSQSDESIKTFKCSAYFSLPVKPVQALSCVIDNVPSTVVGNSYLRPRIKITNTARNDLNLRIKSSYQNEKTGDNSAAVLTKLGSLKAGSSITKENFNNKKFPKRTYDPYVFTADVQNVDNPSINTSCEARFNTAPDTNGTL